MRVDLEPLFVVQIPRDDQLTATWARQQKTLEIVQRGALVTAYAKLFEQPPRGNRALVRLPRVAPQRVQPQHPRQVGGGRFGVRNEACHHSDSPADSMPRMCHSNRPRTTTWSARL